MKKIVKHVISLALIFLLLGGAAHGAIYDAAADFSSSSNPNDPWSYRYAVIGTANSTSALLNSASPTLGWTYSQFSLISSDDPYSTDEPPGTLFVHPGSDVDMLLSFQFPGDFDPNRPVDVFISLADASDGGADWAGSQNISLYKNDVLIFGETVPNGWFAQHTFFSDSVQMGIGDILTVRINKDEEFNWDGVYLGVQYSQEAVPIPGAVWLLGSGLVGIIGFRSKFKKYSSLNK